MILESKLGYAYTLSINFHMHGLNRPLTAYTHSKIWQLLRPPRYKHLWLHHIIHTAVSRFEMWQFLDQNNRSNRLFGVGEWNKNHRLVLYCISLLRVPAQRANDTAVMGRHLLTELGSWGLTRQPDEYTCVACVCVAINT